MESTGSFVLITGSLQYSAAPDVIRDAKSPCSSGRSDSWPLQRRTTLHRYATEMRPPALGLELGRFQSAYGAPTATAHASSESGRLPLRAGVYEAEFDVSDELPIG